MESVSLSPCSPEDCVSKKAVKTAPVANESSQRNKNYTSGVLCDERSIRMAQGESHSRSLDDRRDDYFAMNRPMWHHLQTSTTKRSSWYNYQKYPHTTFHLPSVIGTPLPRWHQPSHSTHWCSRGVHDPTYHQVHHPRYASLKYNGRTAGHTRERHLAQRDCSYVDDQKKKVTPEYVSISSGNSTLRVPHQISKALFPQNIAIPKEKSHFKNNEKFPKRTRIQKQLTSDLSNQLELHPTKKVKKEECFDKLDLLCSATLELGPLQENPSGCSCPKSRCIALYCDCFKAGRHCNTKRCSCLNCKNTITESGPSGARSRVRG